MSTTRNNEIAAQVGQDKSVHEAHKVVDAQCGIYDDSAVTQNRDLKQQTSATKTPFASVKE